MNLHETIEFEALEERNEKLAQQLEKDNLMTNDEIFERQIWALLVAAFVMLTDDVSDEPPTKARLREFRDAIIYMAKADKELEAGRELIKALPHIPLNTLSQIYVKIRNRIREVKAKMEAENAT